MTHSIIRRFARYHGLAPDTKENSHWLVAALAIRLHGDEGASSRDKIIQSLTRIEDAEHALSRASLVYFGRTPREQNEAEAIGDELFAKAGIDTDKWREVKDEEA